MLKALHHNKNIVCRTYNTQVDINLKQWAESSLAPRAVEIGWETLREQFTDLLEKSKNTKDHDSIFDSLKSAVWDESCKLHHWDEKAMEVLRVIQLNALEDTAIADKYQWDNAIKFLEKSLTERLEKSMT